MIVEFNVDDIRRLGKVNGKMKWKEISEVQYIYNLAKGKGIENDEIGYKCANHLRNIALRRKTSVKDLLANCPSLRQGKKKESKEKKYTKNYFRGRGGGRDIGDTQPRKISNTERIIEAIGAQNRAAAQQAAQFQIGQTQRLLTLPNQTLPNQTEPPPLMIQDKQKPPAIPLPNRFALDLSQEHTPDLKKELGLENWPHPNLDDNTITTDRKAELRALDGKRNARVESYLRGIGPAYDMRTYNRPYPPPIAYDDNGDEINWSKYKPPSNIDLSRVSSNQTNPEPIRTSQIIVPPADDTSKLENTTNLPRVPQIYINPHTGKEDSDPDLSDSDYIREFGSDAYRDRMVSDARFRAAGWETDTDIASSAIEGWQTGSESKSDLHSSQGVNPFQVGAEGDGEEEVARQQQIKDLEELFKKRDGTLKKMEDMLEGMRPQLEKEKQQIENTRQMQLNLLNSVSEEQRKAAIRNMISQGGKHEQGGRELLEHYGYESQSSKPSSSSSEFSVDTGSMRSWQEDLVKDLKDATPSEAADYLLQREEAFAPKTKEEMLENLSGQSFKYKANQTKQDINQEIGAQKERLAQIKIIKENLKAKINHTTRDRLSTEGSFQPASGVRQEAIRNLAQQQEGEEHNQLHPSGLSRQTYYHSLESVREKLKAKANQTKTRNELRDEELARVQKEMGTFGATRKPTQEYLETHSAAEVFQQKKIDMAEDALIAQREKGPVNLGYFTREGEFKSLNPTHLGDTMSEEGKPTLHYLQTHSMAQYLQQQKEDKAAVAAQNPDVLPEGARYDSDGNIMYGHSAFSYL